MRANHRHQQSLNKLGTALKSLDHVIHKMDSDTEWYTLPEEPQLNAKKMRVSKHGKLTNPAQTRLCTYDNVILGMWWIGFLFTVGVAVVAIVIEFKVF